MADTGKNDMEALAGGTSVSLVIPPIPKPQFTDRFKNAFPDDVRLQLQHHEEMEQWRQKTNQAILSKLT